MVPPIAVPPALSWKLEKYKVALFSEIWCDQKLASYTTCAKQCYRLYHQSELHMFGGEEYIPHYSDIAHFLGLSQEHVRSMVKAWQKVEDGEGLGHVGRPSLFSAAQRSTILQDVDKCDGTSFLLPRQLSVCGLIRSSTLPSPQMA